MTIISNKKSVNKGVKSMTAKAMSWTQVCKQLSGIGGYVEIGEGEKVRPIELMWSLGVHVEKNSYKPNDIFAAWNERLKDGKQVLISHGVPFNIDVMGFSYRLCTKSTKEEGKYVGVSVKQLCPLVSATDKDTNTVTVNAANVLKGLQQSVFVDATLEAIQKSEEKCTAMCEGYINLTRDKKSPAQWVHVAKDKDGVWSIVPEKAVAPSAKEVASAAKAAAKESTKSAPKKGAKTLEKPATKSVEHKTIVRINAIMTRYRKGMITREECNDLISQAMQVA